MVLTAVVPVRETEDDWRQHASRDPGQNEIAIAVGMLIEEAVEMQPAQSAEDCGDLAVSAGADDVEGLRQRGTEGGGAFRDGAQRIDFGRGQWERLAMVRLWTCRLRGSSRGGGQRGESRFGTTATYM